VSIARITHDTDASVVTRARVQIPAWGCWWCDVELQTALELDAGDAVVVALADVTIVGTVVAGAAAHGRASYRIVAGAGGWGTSLSARAYHDAAGVRVSTVLTDAAADAGETLGTLPSTRVGPHFARSSGSASRVLHELAPRAWYVDFAGITQIGARTETTYDGDATRAKAQASDDTIELVTDTLTGLVPGVVVDDLAAATDVEYVLTDARLTARVCGGPRTSRDLDAFRRVLDALDPRRAYRAAYEYRVVTQDGGALNLQPVRSSAGMPDLERVPVRLAPGFEADHYLGSLVTVVFLDGDPSRPRVISGDDAGAPGWAPIATTIESTTTVDIGASPRLGVARVGDAVQAGPWSGVITTSSLTVKAGA